MDNMDSFAPPVDIQAELDAAPEVRIDAQEEAPPEAAEAPPAKAEEAQADAPDETKEQKTVPLAALAEARRQAKDMRAKMEESDRANAAAIAELSKKLDAAINPPSKEPDFAEYPAENLRQRTERLEQEQQAWKEERARQAKETEEQTQHRQAVSYVTTEMDKAEAQFSAKTPDYLEAVKYLRSVSEKNLRVMGVTDPAEIQKITIEQSFGMAANAIRQGLNPAEVAYQFAKSYGYTHKVDVTKQIKAMAEAQSKTQTMGNGKPDTEFSIAALAEMSDEDVDANWGKIKKIMS